MKRNVIILLSALIGGAAFGADAMKPRVVIVVRPQYQAATFAGTFIGNAIAQWIMNRQNRAAYGNCDALFDSKCHPPAMQQGPAPWPIDSAAQTGPGTYYVSGQCPGLEPCETATAAQQFVDPNASARPLTAEYTIYSNLAHAEVCVDLKTVGFTTGQPFVIELPSGRRQVVVKYAGFANVTEDIEAGPGEERTITADFR